MLYKGFRRLGSMWTNETRNEENRMFSELFGVTNSFQQQIDNLVVSSGDSPAEVVQARGEYNLLYQRLDNYDLNNQSMSLELQQQKNKNDEQDIEIQKINTEKANKKELEQFIGSTSINDLSYPLIVAHRGAKAIYPENSIEAMQYANDDGYPIELDVMLNGDGIPVLSHDTTMNRTTNLGGNIKNYTTAGFLNAKVNELGTSLVGSTTTLENVFRVMGNRAIYILESKEVIATESILELIEKYGMRQNVIMQSFNYEDARRMASLGYEVCYLRGAGASSPTTVKDDGINVVGMNKNVTKSVITQHKNAGLDVWIYTVNERKEAKSLFSDGADALFSDDPRWVDGTAKILNRDNFNQQTWYHGQKTLPKGANGSAVQGNRGEFYPPGKFGWLKAAPGGGVGLNSMKDFTLQGWAGELSTNFKLEGTIFIEEISQVYGGYASVTICTPNEYFDDHSSGSSGYNLTFWASGTMRNYIVSEGGYISGEDKTDLGGLVEGQRIDFTVEVIGDKITLKRNDGQFTGTVFTETNTKFRNGFLHLGRSTMGVTFGNLKYTPL